MEKQISIIIPTYNMEKYIGKCLDSLLIPEFDQVEVLVVNDGSKDRSSEIAHEYAVRYPDSIRVIDKPNGNYGSCINTALPLATGRYVKVLDADDTFDKEAFSKFVQLLKTVDEDVIITLFSDYNSVGEEVRRDVIDYYKAAKDRACRFNEVKDTDLSLYPAMHRLTYKIDIFKRFVYHQTEGISYTDTEWAMIPLAFADTFRFTDIYLYRYLVGRQGQTMNPQEIYKSLSHFFLIANEMINMHDTTVLSLERKEFLSGRIVSFIKGIILRIIEFRTKDSMNQLKEFIEHLRIENPVMYEKVEKIKYDSNVSFYLLRDIVKKNYPENYQVPRSVLLRLSLNLKIKKFRK